MFCKIIKSLFFFFFIAILPAQAKENFRHYDLFRPDESFTYVNLSYIHSLSTDVNKIKEFSFANNNVYNTALNEYGKTNATLNRNRIGFEIGLGKKTNSLLRYEGTFSFFQTAASLIPAKGFIDLGSFSVAGQNKFNYFNLFMRNIAFNTKLYIDLPVGRFLPFFKSLKVFGMYGPSFDITTGSLRFGNSGVEIFRSGEDYSNFGLSHQYGFGLMGNLFPYVNFQFSIAQRSRLLKLGNQVDLGNGQKVRSPVDYRTSMITFGLIFKNKRD